LTDTRCDAARGPYVIVAIPLLVETGGADRFDRVLVVDAEPAVQLARLQARDGNTISEGERILAAQLSARAPGRGERRDPQRTATSPRCATRSRRCIVDMSRPPRHTCPINNRRGPQHEHRRPFHRKCAVYGGRRGRAEYRDVRGSPGTAGAGGGNRPARLRAAAQRADAHVSAPRLSLQPGAVSQRDESQWGSRAAMGSLLDILAIAARGDVRADVQKELERHLAQLNVFQSKPGVDSARLRTVMSNLLRLRADLVACGSNYLAGLKDSEFSRPSKHRSAIPGGTCEFDLPDFFFWLNQATDQRLRSFNEWLATLGRCATPLRSCCGSRGSMASRARRLRAPALPHHVRTRHAHSAVRIALAGELGPVSRDQRFSLPVQRAVAGLERIADAASATTEDVPSPSPAVLSQWLTPHIGKRGRSGPVRE